MPKSKRPWNEDAVAKLKAMAGKEQWERIGAVLGRTRATAVQASKRGLSLRIKRPAKPRQTRMVHQRKRSLTSWG